MNAPSSRGTENSIADAHGKNHDYHLVDPSPWPLAASLSALASAIGAIVWMRSMGGGAGLFGIKGPWLFAIGFTCLVFVAARCWGDIITEAHKGDHTPVLQLHLRYGMIMFIASEVLFFVAWFWVYFHVALFPDDVRDFDPAPPSSAACGRGYNRVYDTLEMEANLNHVDEFSTKAMELLGPEKELSSEVICRALGQVLAEDTDGGGVLRSAYLKGVPVCVPALTDSELGLDLATWAMRHARKRGEIKTPMDLFNVVPRYNPFHDLISFARFALGAKKLGIFTIGGGVPRNWAQEVGPFVDITNDRLDESFRPPRYHYAVRICPEPVHWGGLSKVNGKEETFVYQLEFDRNNKKNDFIPPLWATRAVGYLLDQIRLNGENKELKDEIVRLSKKYGIITPNTTYRILEDESQISMAPPPIRRNQVILQDKMGSAPAEKAKMDYDSSMEQKEGEISIRSSTEIQEPNTAGNLAASKVGRSSMEYTDLKGNTNNAADDLVQVQGRAMYQNNGQWIDGNIVVNANKNLKVDRVQFNDVFGQVHDSRIPEKIVMM